MLAGEADELFPILVFIHGVGLNHQVWQPQIDFFAERYQVLAYDMLGHGESPLPDENAGMTAYVNQLRSLLSDLAINGSLVIVGHSMGALVGMAFALAEQFNERVQKLVLLNMVYQRTAAQRKAVVARAAKVLEEGRIAGMDAALERWFAGKTSAADLEKIARVRQWLSQVNPVGYGRTYQLFATSDLAFSGQLSQLRMPVLYLTGEFDPNSTPVMSDQLASATPSGFADALANEAHMMAYIAPEKVNPLLDDFIATYFSRY